MTASLRLSVAALAVAGVASVCVAGRAQAQGVKAQGKASANLTFAMTARVFYKDGATASEPAQTINAKVWLSGRKARMDTTLSGRPMRLLLAPPYAYRLLTSSKIGQRFRASALPGLGGVMSGAEALSPDPKTIRATLIQGGARKSGSAVLGGVPVDVFTSSRFRDRADKVKAFLRRSDSLPLRVEIDSKNFSAIASWRDYQKPVSLSPALFAIPSGFKIREGQPGAF